MTTSEMAQRINPPATKPVSLRLSPGPHVVDGAQTPDLHTMLWYGAFVRTLNK